MLEFGETQHHNVSLDPIPLPLGVPRRGDSGNRDGGQFAIADAGRGWKSGERCSVSCTKPSRRIHFILFPCLCPRLWQIHGIYCPLEYLHQPYRLCMKIIPVLRMVRQEPGGHSWVCDRAATYTCAKL